MRALGGFGEQLSMSMSEELFRQAVHRMKAVGLEFWLERGTLLGLIRDGAVIRWDDDYDFGTWRHEGTEAMIHDAFDTGEFEIQSLAERGIDGFHITYVGDRRAGRIDVIVYTESGDRAVHRSRCVLRKPWTPLVLSLQRFIDPQMEADHWMKRLIELAFHRGILQRLRPKVRDRLIREAEALLDGFNEQVELSYEFPAELFRELRIESFLGVRVPVPVQAERYLECAYGGDWRTPRRWRHWSEGATHVRGELRDERFSGA